MLYRAIRELTRHKTVCRLIDIGPSPTATGLREQVKVLAGTRPDNVEHPLGAEITVPIVEVGHHPFKQRIGDDDIELRAFHSMNRGDGNARTVLKYLPEEGNAAYPVNAL